MTECSFDRPRSRVRTLLWFLSFGYFGQPHSSIEIRVASNHSVLPGSHISFVPSYGSVLLSFPLGGYIASIVCTFYSGLCDQH
jgi:hypothetical protein